MTVGTSVASGDSARDLADYRLNIKEHWTPPEGESSDQLSGFYYIPNFITEQEEEYLIEKVLKLCLPTCCTNLLMLLRNCR
jgi:hypothetical protein